MRRYLTDDLDMEDFLTVEGIDYKLTQGGQGMQLNLRECPSCHDDRWKVYLNAETGLGNCFKCGEKFNKWSFVGFVLQTEDKRTVAQYITQHLTKLGFQPRREKREAPAPVEQGKLQLPSSMKLPTTDGRNASYLEERGVSAHYAEYFDLRLCLSGIFPYVTDDGEKKFANFSNRILIPVRDLDGEIVTFQGRDFTGKVDPKYLFPPKLPGTGRFLYNGHRAYGARAREVLVGEGAFDVIAQKIAIDKFEEMRGIIPVGTFGKHLSETVSGPSQLDAFRRLKNEAGLERVTIMWDGEPDALTAALEAAGKLRGIGLAVKVALLPKDCDPAEVGSEVVYQAWKDALTFAPTLTARLRLRNPYAS